jgi:hypothetical protein
MGVGATHALLVLSYLIGGPSIAVPLAALVAVVSARRCSTGCSCRGSAGSE